MALGGVGVGEDHAPLTGRADTRIQQTCTAYVHIHALDILQCQNSAAFPERNNETVLDRDAQNYTF